MQFVGALNKLRRCTLPRKWLHRKYDWYNKYSSNVSVNWFPVKEQLVVVGLIVACQSAGIHCIYFVVSYLLHFIGPFYVQN